MTELNESLKGKMEELINNYIKLNQPCKRKDLHEHLRNNGYIVTDTEMRLAIQDMINNKGYLIGSGNAGYHIIDNKDKLETDLKYLRQKATSIFVRAQNLHQSYFKQGNEQLKLSLEEFMK
jgi:hypothetical protein